MGFATLRARTISPSDNSDKYILSLFLFRYPRKAGKTTAAVNDGGRYAILWKSHWRHYLRRNLGRQQRRMRWWLWWTPGLPRTRRELVFARSGFSCARELQILDSFHQGCWIRKLDWSHYKKQERKLEHRKNSFVKLSINFNLQRNIRGIGFFYLRYKLAGGQHLCLWGLVLVEPWRLVFVARVNFDWLPKWSLLIIRWVDCYRATG